MKGALDWVEAVAGAVQQGADIEAEEAQAAAAKGKSGGSLLGKLGLMTKKRAKQAA